MCDFASFHINSIYVKEIINPIIILVTYISLFKFRVLTFRIRNRVIDIMVKICL